MCFAEYRDMMLELQPIVEIVPDEPRLVFSDIDCFGVFQAADTKRLFSIVAWMASVYLVMATIRHFAIQMVEFNVDHVWHRAIMIVG